MRHRVVKMSATSALKPAKKAVVLLSGGLDSALAAALLIRQGVEVEGVFFNLPFYSFKKRGRPPALDVARALGIKLKMTTKDKEFIQIVRKPRHGYGKRMNPCIDCKIFMLKEAKKYAKKIGASVVVTGEVLGERPMSQHRRALEIIEREVGLKCGILRPLSAKLLPETDAEKNGTVDRDRLLDISGRQRKRQIELAKTLGIIGYSSPAGGCLLTDKHFAVKLKDLFRHTKKVTQKDIELLKLGRHFRHGPNKIIVGRDETENRLLHELKRKRDYHFEVSECGSPITLLQGPESEEAIKIAATLTAHYSDSEDDPVVVMYGRQKLNEKIRVTRISESEISRLRVT